MIFFLLIAQRKVGHLQNESQAYKRILDQTIVLVVVIGKAEITINFVFTRFSTASIICRFFTLRAYQALISSVGVLPLGSAVLYSVQMCILPERVSHREHIRKP
jgi:hypothetical protein